MSENEVNRNDCNRAVDPIGTVAHEFSGKFAGLLWVADLLGGELPDPHDKRAGDGCGTDIDQKETIPGDLVLAREGKYSEANRRNKSSHENRFVSVFSVQLPDSNLAAGREDPFEGRQAQEPGRVVASHREDENVACEDSCDTRDACFQEIRFAPTDGESAGNKHRFFRNWKTKRPDEQNAEHGHVAVLGDLSGDIHGGRRERKVVCCGSSVK